MDSTDPAAYTPLSYAQLNADAAPRPWLWRGYLLPGAVTLLTSQWKSGKTTLLAVLLARMREGGELAGLPVRAGRAVVVSEEAPDLWWRRGRGLGLDGHVGWLCRPFRGRPSVVQWIDLIDRVGRLHAREGVDLLAIDPLAGLAPLKSENDSAAMLEALMPLQRLTERGVAVLLCHHPRKGRSRAGESPRGSGALPACADVLVEMHTVGRRGGVADRRRVLRSSSRYAETLATWAIEWAADGTDYRALGPSAEPDFAVGRPVVRAIPEKADGPLTRGDLLRAWSDAAVKLAGRTLWKWLGVMACQGEVERWGKGTRREPHEYSLPGRAVEWRARELERMFQGIAGAG